MTIIGIGIDILHLPRLTKLLTRTINSKTKFAKRILSSIEYEEWLGREKDSNVTRIEQERWLAIRWTAKEATYKALYPNYVPIWKELSIIKSSGSPKPTLVLNQTRGTRIEAGEVEKDPLEGAKFHLSVSHDGEYVISNVLVER